MLCIRQPLQTRQAHNHTNTTSRSNSNFVFVTLQTTKPQPLQQYLCSTPGNHNFHNLGPLRRKVVHNMGIHNMETSQVVLVLVSKKTMLYRTYVTPITRLLNSSWRSLFSIWRSSILEPPHRFDPPLF